MRKLLIATSNPGKLHEVVAILAGLPVEFATLRDFPDVPPAVEDGDTFEENACRKAVHYASRTGLWTLADDSGLEVDALDGAPGVYSARYAGENATDADNNAKLIGQLASVAPERRTARFRCVMALARPGVDRALGHDARHEWRGSGTGGGSGTGRGSGRDRGSGGIEALAHGGHSEDMGPSGLIVATASGTYEGVIVDDPRGHNGFGYDPHFFVEPFVMTSAQMPPELKNAVSHRAKALQAIRPELERLFR